jgi:hypothetical protein
MTSRISWKLFELNKVVLINLIEQSVVMNLTMTKLVKKLRNSVA